MGKINPCFKKTFIFFNSLLAIFGIVIFIFAAIGQQFAEEGNSRYGVILLYVAGSLIFLFSVLGVYAAYRESKCALIVFFSIMCLATGFTLRIVIPLATHRGELRSVVQEYLQSPSAMTTEMKHALPSMQQYFKCCGLSNGYKDWEGGVPESCNCDSPYTNECRTVTIQKGWYRSKSETRQVWSKPCGSVILEYFDKIMNFTLGLFIILAVLAILGGLMSLMMIINISNYPPASQVPALPLTYHPPKYSEVVG